MKKDRASDATCHASHTFESHTQVTVKDNMLKGGDLKGGKKLKLKCQWGWGQGSIKYKINLIS